MKKGIIRKRIEDRKANMTEEEKLKQAELVEIFTKEIENLTGVGKEQKIYRLELDYSRFKSFKILYCTLMIMILVGYAVLGQFSTANSDKVLMALPFILAVIPVLFTLLGAIRPITLVEVMSEKSFNVVFKKIPKHVKCILFLFAIMWAEDSYFLVKSFFIDGFNMNNETVYWILLLVYTIACIGFLKVAQKNVKYIKLYK